MAFEFNVSSHQVSSIIYKVDSVMKGFLLFIVITSLFCYHHYQLIIFFISYVELFKQLQQQSMIISRSGSWPARGLSHQIIFWPARTLPRISPGDACRPRQSARAALFVGFREFRVYFTPNGESVPCADDRIGAGYRSCRYQDSKP